MQMWVDSEKVKVAGEGSVQCAVVEAAIRE